jgi:hypothetical protein
MAWLKRNLGLVIGGVVALALLGLGGWYLYTKIQEDEAVNNDLETATTSFKDIVNRPVHPGNEKVNNIQLAKEENKKLEDLLAQMRARIAGPSLPKELNNKEFRALLDNTVTELRRNAEKLGIGLPGTPPGTVSDYWFTFQPQKTAVEFKNLDTLTYQLLDIKSICDVLYNAKVHDLIGLKRVAASSDENGGEFLSDKRITTNDVAIVMPYEVTFQGFSSELAQVMEGLIKAKQCFVVKNIGVDKAPSTQPAAPMRTPPPPMYSNPYASPYGNPYRSRYGMGMMPPPVAAAPQPQPGLRKNVLLDENKLRITLAVDSVRAKPVKEKKAEPKPQQLTQAPPPTTAPAQ